MILVVDASLLIDVLIGQQGIQAARRRLFQEGVSLCAPSLLRLETLDVLRRLSLSQKLSEAQAHLAFAAFLRLPLSYYPEEILVRRIWTLRRNVTAFDAAYLALAESLRAPLLTRDERLSKVTGARTVIEYVPLLAQA